MNAASETLVAPAAPASPVRPFYWSVRREFWEHRALYIAPLVAAGVVLLACVLNAMHLSDGLQMLAELSPERQRRALTAAFMGVSFAIVLAGTVAASFYLLDTLQGERRDRSVLFWKSMPVSDTTTVLAKLFTATMAVPAIAFVIIVVTLVLLLLLSTLVVLISGASAAPLWANLQFFEKIVSLLYMLVVMVLWYAPITGWLLLISSWAKRSTFLWAVLPPIAIIVFEKVALGTGYFARLIEYRFEDGLATAFVPRGQMAISGSGVGARVDLGKQYPEHMLQLLDPAQFLSNIWLWVGLAAAAAFVAAAIWMRRYREPL